MAEVHVTDWDELYNAVSSATENTTVYLDNDIDLNGTVYETGVTQTIMRSAEVYITIEGNNHSIKNIYHKRANEPYHSNQYVFSGYQQRYTEYTMNINNVNFENVTIDYIQSLGSSTPCFANYCKFNNCTISCTLLNNYAGGGSYEASSLFGTDYVYLNQCALTVNGIGNGTTNPCLYFGGQSWFNNIYLSGDFSKINMPNLYYSYVQGDFKQNLVGNSTVNFRIAGVANAINAAIDMARVINSDNSSMTVINTDNLTFPSGSSASDLPANLLHTDTAGMKSVTTLRNLGFPIRIPN